MIVGLPAVPNQAAVSAVVFFLTAATLSALSGFPPVHNVAEYGPNDPAATPALIMPDWFLMWVYGFLKLLPTWLSFSVGPVHVSTEFIGGIVLPGLVFAAAVAFIMIASIAGMNNILPSKVLGTTTGVANPILTAALLGVPPLFGGITYLLLRGEASEPGRDDDPAPTAADSGGGADD